MRCRRLPVVLAVFCSGWALCSHAFAADHDSSDEWDFRSGDSTPLLIAAGPTGVQAASASQPAGIWVSNTSTSSQRPIEVSRIGNGPQIVLLIGSVYGNEPEAIEVIDRTVRLVRTNPVPPGVTLLFVRTPNPDGYVDLIRTNARGVDLNRNFPSPGFTTKPNRLTGPRAASEVEVQYMLRVFQEYPVARVVHLRSGPHPHEQPYVVINDKWSAPQAGAATADLSLHNFAGEYKAGSLEEYVSLHLKSSLAVVHVPLGNPDAVTPANLLRFALAGLGGPSEKPASMNTSTSPSPANRAPPTGSFTAAEPAPKTDGAKGNVNFLDPPPGRANTKNSPSADARYFELPPPPKS